MWGADVTSYKPATEIVLTILGCIWRNQSNGRALKTHVIQCANFKTTSAETYLDTLKEAGYIMEMREDWGRRALIKTISTELFGCRQSSTASGTGILRKTLIPP